MTEASPAPRATATTLDYYLLSPVDTDTSPTGLLIEEFVLADDLSALRLRSAGWTSTDGGWWSSAAFAQRLRTDPKLRARVEAVTRSGAEATYRRLGCGALPDEGALRGHFRDDVSLASGNQLRLGVGEEVHRVLFAGALDADRLAHLRASLHIGGGTDPSGARPGVVGTGRLRINATDFRWDLRSVGGGVAWCIDVTCEPARGEALRSLLRHLTDVARRHGLLPATIECLS